MVFATDFTKKSELQMKYNYVVYWLLVNEKNYTETSCPSGQNKWIASR